MDKNSKILPAAASRTHNSVRNAAVGVFFFIVMTVLQFISRRVFIEYLGVKVLGINSTIVSLLEFLNMAELGIATAVSFTLYGPLARGDRAAISGIIGLHRSLYRWVALAMTLGGGILMLFFPQIFAKSGLPLWYAYSTFAVLLFGAVAGYLFNYTQVLLTASQQDYKVNIAYRGSKSIIILLQILAIINFARIGYQLWLILEVAGIILTAMLLYRMVRHTYPALKISDEKVSVLRRRYPEVMRKTGLMMYHKIGGFLVRQSTPFMVYLFVSVSTVAVYANYLLIMTGLTRLVEAIFKGVEAGIGNLSHTGSADREVAVFSEMLSLRILIGSVLFYGFYFCANPFTALWVGGEYTFPTHTLLLLGMLLYTWTLKGATESFALAKGVVGDIWAPLAEGGITIGISVICGYCYGLDGVILGALSGVALLTFVWKPYYLFTRGFGKGMADLRRLYAWPLVRSIVTGLVITLLLDKEIIMEYAGFSIRTPEMELWISMVFSMIFTVLFLMLQYAADPGSRRLVSRLTSYLFKK